MVTCLDLQTVFLFCFSENWPLWCYCYSHDNVATFSILIPIQQCGSHDNEEVTLAVWLLASPSLSALLSFIKQGKWESSHLSSTWGVVSQWGLSFRREEAPQETLRSLSPSGGLGLISHHLLVQRSPPHPFTKFPHAIHRSKGERNRRTVEMNLSRPATAHSFWRNLRDCG